MAEAELGADPRVHVFRQRLGHLDAEPMQVEVILVAVGEEPLARHLRGALADGDRLQPDHVELGAVRLAHEVGDAEAALAVLARQLEARQLAAPRVVEEHQIVALAGRLPIAVDRRRPQDVLGDTGLDEAREDRAQLAPGPLPELLAAPPRLAIAPMELIEHGLVEVGKERLDLDLLQHACAPEGGLGHRDGGVELGPAQADLLGLDRALGSRLGLRPARLALGRGLGRLFLRRRLEVIVEAPAGHLGHEVEAVEGVPRIGHAAPAVGRHAVGLDVAAGERGAAQEDRELEPLAAHLLEVLAHDHRRFHQQPRHADGVGAVLGGGVEDVREGLLDA